MLETKNVFIDTQYFVKSNLHFDNAAMTAFRKLCKADELVHITTSVVEREVEDKIQTSVQEALTAIGNFRRKARLLSSLDDKDIKNLFTDIVEEDMYKKASNVFEQFMKDCKTTPVDASNVNAEDILNLYFDKKPPFGDGKKKSEFPDAFSLFSIRSHLSQNEKIYVISDDNDMKTFCDNDPQMLSLNSLDKLLDLYSLHTSALTNQIKEYFASNTDLIKERVKEYLENCEIYNSSTWEDAEVEDGLEVISVGSIDPLVLEVSNEDSQVTFDINVEYDVKVSGPDSSSGVYDSESGNIFTFESSSQDVRITATFAVTVWLSYEFLEGQLQDIDIFDFEIPSASRGIEISVEEFEEELYR
jgi:hypothetical protein